MSPPSQSAQTRAIRDAAMETPQPRVMFRLEESRLPRGKIEEAAKVSVGLERLDRSLWGKVLHTISFKRDGVNFFLDVSL